MTCLYNSPGRYHQLAGPALPILGKFGISQPQELSQLKVKGQEQQDEP